MPLKLMYITNNPRVAQIAENNTVDRIWVDLERNGKKQRQNGLNTVISNHSIEDVSKIRECIDKSELLVRINPLHEGSRSEIDEVIERGADVVMLPFFETCEDACRFVEFVGGRATTLLLVETIKAEEDIENIVEKSGADEVHIGLNDLHIQYNLRFMFELLSNGKVAEICNKVKKGGMPFGFGGIAKLDEGLLPARYVIAEHYRIGSSMAILSRSFYDTWLNDDYEEIERSFRYGMKEIREYEERLSKETPDFFENNRKLVIDIVDELLKNMR